MTRVNAINSIVLKTGRGHFFVVVVLDFQFSCQEREKNWISSWNSGNIEADVIRDSRLRLAAILLKAERPF